MERNHPRKKQVQAQGEKKMRISPLTILKILLAMYLVPFMLLVLPAAVMYIYDIILEKIFRKYMSEEDLKRELELDMENH